ncbi:MAG TPA: hypothetical protein VKJ07_11105, partial [Mycobacteriales bacterium]|nr:hypothetical protein [Mycobacteriales bacterium]
IKSNRLGMDPATLFPPRNDGSVGVTGEGAGRVSIPDAILATTAGVVAYTPVARNADNTLTTGALQPSWGLDDVAPGEARSQTFVLRGGPNMMNDTANVTFSIQTGSEALGIKAAPASWFTLPSSAAAARGRDSGQFTPKLTVPANAAPGQYTATIIAKADLGNGVTEKLRIPVQFFVPAAFDQDVTAPIWASDTTDYSIVGAENPEAQIYSDWTMVPVRVPTTGAANLTFKVWDDAGASTMDVFVFDKTGTEVNSTVSNDPSHAVPLGAALSPTTKDAPGTTTVTIVASNVTPALGEAHAGDVLWVVVSDTKPANPIKFETYHLSVSKS